MRMRLELLIHGLESSVLNMQFLEQKELLYSHLRVFAFGSMLTTASHIEFCTCTSHVV